MHRYIAAAAVAFTLGACAPAAQQSGSNTPAPNRTTLTVENNNFQDVTVYLIGGSTRTRLGTVTSMKQEEFRIPQTLASGVADLVIEAVPFGNGETYRSPTFQITPGSQVSLRVGQQMLLSNLRLYERGLN